MQVIHDDLWLCQDCLMAAVNGDLSGVDYYLSGDAATKRKADIEAGLAELGPHLVPDFDCETGEGIEEFSSRWCECCGERLAGGRHRFAVLG